MPLWHMGQEIFMRDREAAWSQFAANPEDRPTRGGATYPASPGSSPGGLTTLANYDLSSIPTARKRAIFLWCMHCE
jgi:hypothetical protein